MSVYLKDVMERLSAPFQPGEEKYRPGPTWESDGTRWTKPLAFIDARTVFDRLDAVVGPGNWETHLERLAPGVYLCKLTVCAVTRSDIGMAGGNESEPDKAGASDAIKRAAVQFGIGRYLYGRELAPVRLERRGNDWVLPRGWQPPKARPAVQAETEAASTVPFKAPDDTRATGRQIARISAELVRVGWSEQEGRQYLITTFGKRSRSQLTIAEASRFIKHLAALTERSAVN